MIRYLLLAVCFVSTVQAEFLYDVKEIYSEDGSALFLTDINELGHACGYIESGRMTEAILYQNGEIIHLGSLPMKDSNNPYARVDGSSKATTLNNFGQVAGVFKGNDENLHGFVWQNGVMVDLGEFVPTDNNDLGCLVGYKEAERMAGDKFLPQIRECAFSYYNGKFYNLGAFPGNEASVGSRAYGINNSFQIVGENIRGRNHAFIWQDGEMVQIESPYEKWQVASAYGINEKGYVTGTLEGLGTAAFAQIDGRLLKLEESLIGRIRAFDITSDGLVLGDNKRRDMGCLWVPNREPIIFNASFRSLNRQHAFFSSPPTAVNSHGQIIGCADAIHPKSGKWTIVGMIATPVSYRPRPVVLEKPRAPEVGPFEPKVEPPVEIQPIRPPNLLFITHGFDSNADGWVKELADLFDQKLKEMGQRDQWEIIAYDWSSTADPEGMKKNEDVLKPATASRNAGDIGILFGTLYAKRHYKKIQLIAHSAGSWVIQEISRKVNTEDCFVQVTFLDAFIPEERLGQDNLGRYADFAEHYRDHRYLFLRDTPLERFGSPLDFCFNKDVTEKDPLQIRGILGSHGWPHEWYMNSIGSGYGLDLSIVLGNSPENTGEFTRLVEVGR